MKKELLPRMYGTYISLKERLSIPDLIERSKIDYKEKTGYMANTVEVNESEEFEENIIKDIEVRKIKNLPKGTIRIFKETN